jgi:alkanesulfonate monooxygenase SsuD/methylene tetrahydromethanopterin reductase-like flavin-dependent oxidoreductase (luciferase family)
LEAPRGASLRSQRYSNGHSRAAAEHRFRSASHGPGHVAPTDEQAREEFWPHWRELIRLVAAERSFAIPTEESFAYETGPEGALYVGSPETVVQKIATNLRTLAATRFDLKYGAGGLPHETLMTNIELFGRQVIPRVRELMKE